MKKLKLILDAIIKAYKFVKDWTGFIIQIIAVIGIVTTFLSVRGCIKKDVEKQGVIEILTSKAEKFETKSGLNASKVNEWQIKYKTLERLNGEISHDNNAYLNELSKAKETIEDLGLRLKDVKTYISNELISKDSIRTKIEFINCDRIKIEPIEKKHIKIDFVQNNEYLDIKYQYKANVSTVINREKDPNQFFLWRWIKPRWTYSSISVIDDKNAEIENNVNIEFKK